MKNFLGITNNSKYKNLYYLLFIFLRLRVCLLTEIKHYKSHKKVLD